MVEYKRNPVCIMQHVFKDPAHYVPAFSKEGNTCFIHTKAQFTVVANISAHTVGFFFPLRALAKV